MWPLVPRAGRPFGRFTAYEEPSAPAQRQIRLYLASRLTSGRVARYGGLHRGEP
jgi:hypothetical protein